MAKPDDTPSMAVFCDFENVALGVRDAKYEKFDIRKVLERLLLKGSIVVKKAYCDWARYREFKAEMHEASFELIEIPHVRQSGKNSADIRMVVDALDLCYTKGHVDTFVIISGDSDFSPLVSKLRENAKTVIGVGVKGSTSDLLTANCDEFIFYDDLVREQRRRGATSAARRDGGRDPNRDPNRDANRNDPNRGSGRGNGRDRDAPREPLRSVPTGPAARVPTPVEMPPAGEDLDDTPSVGGPWRAYTPTPRETANDAHAAPVDADTAAASDGVDAGGEAVADAPPPPAAAPGRRTRRTRSRVAEATLGLGSETATAADFAAADLAGGDAPDGAPADARAADDMPTGDAPVDAAPPADDAEPVADAPKKRAPRRRKPVVADTEASDPPPSHASPVDDLAGVDAAPDAALADVDADIDRTADAGAFEPADAEPPRRQRTEDERRQEAVELAVETVEALLAERGADDKIWGSMVKQTLKRRRPGFAESYYGYRSFNELLEEARDRGLLALEHDEKSGGYVIRLL